MKVIYCLLASSFIYVLITLVFAESKVDSIPTELLENSFMIKTPTDSSGSGVLVKNDGHAFVWTAGHVLEDLQKISVVIDVETGRPKAVVSYFDVTVCKSIFVSGRKVGINGRFARILRYSDSDTGEDLGLLELYDGTFGGDGIKFVAEGDVTKPGVPLWHVGSLEGTRGEDSVSDGVFSKAGRLMSRNQFFELYEPRIFDQVSLAANVGCSGGGIFRKSDLACIGLVVVGVSTPGTPSANIVPSRRIREFAKRTKCEWAIDANTAVPSKEEMLKQPIADRPLKLTEKLRAALSLTPPVVEPEPK